MRPRRQRGLLARGQRRQRDAGHRRAAAKLLLAPPGVVQARAEDVVEVEIDDEQILLERPGPADALALFVEHEGLAVEDQLVLSADAVDEGQAREVVAPRAWRASSPAHWAFPA